ncbi:MAG: hypothetical protein QOI67_911 [Gaiellaceae bacterium]|nr:hypothetical protein [Gaiellaceae bacterium]
MTSALAFSIALHTALGLALAGLVWLVGSGCLVLLRRPLDRRSLLDAYPVGLFVVLAAAVPPLVWRPLGVVSGFVVLGAAVMGVRAARLPLGAGTLAVATLGSAVFGGGLGALLHGPTDDLDSAAYGGMLWYVAKVVSAAHSIVPFRDPLAEGETMIYSEAGTSFVGSVLSWLPGFDPILFQAATLPTFAAASLCIGCALFAGDRSVRVPAPLVGIAAALLAVGIVPYPSWMTETPPAAFALPLAFSLWRVWRDELDTRWLVVLSSVVALDYFQTKVIGIMALGLLLVVGLVERHRSRPDFRRVALIGGAVLALGAAAVIGLLFAFASWYAGLAKPKTLPLDALRGLTDGDPDVRSLGLACLVAGEVLLLATLARARSWGLFAAFLVTVLPSWFLSGYGFDVALVSEIFLAALLVMSGLRVDLRLALASGALLAFATAAREPLGPQPGFLLMLALLVALGAVVIRSRTLVRVCVVAAAAAAVLAIVVRGGIDDPAVAITTADHDIWGQVEQRVPEDGLVFTSLTGLEVTPHEGWNNYPAVAERQLFIAGWYDGRLVSHEEDRDRKLAENRSVLTGRTHPRELELSREYPSYYAVARRSEHVPRSFRRVYANDEYVLYEIP